MSATSQPQDMQHRLEEAAAWRLRLARDPALSGSEDYLLWSADPANAIGRSLEKY